MENKIVRVALAFILVWGLSVLPQVARALPPDNWDGLVKTKSKNVDLAFLLPGADFREYKKVMIDPANVEFKKDWMKDINEYRSLSRRIDKQDAAKIAEAARSGFGDVFAAAFNAAGYEVVTTPGDDVLKLTPFIVNLYITAPDVNGPSKDKSFAVEAGEATLVLEARDSTTGALLGRAVDRRATRESARMEWRNSTSNRADFLALFKRWADICVKGLAELTADSSLSATSK